MVRLIVQICMLCSALVVSADPQLPEQCTRACDTPFAQILGQSPSRVVAYSNCNNQCVFKKPAFTQETFTGIQWQCVEYARRWLLINQGVVYGDVNIAADIWEHSQVHTPDDTQRYDFTGIVNGDQDNYVQQGDLLIYSKEFQGTGHVAVVLAVNTEKQLVYVGEQNYSNTPWQNGYAREIAYIMHQGQQWLLDPYLVGWKRVIKE